MKRIFTNTYAGDQVADIYRDVSEAMDESMNPRLKDLPKDEHNFIKGEFVIVIEWHATSDMIDWNKGPKEATHWGPETPEDKTGSKWVEAFYIYLGSGWLVYNENQKTWSDPTHHRDWVNRKLQLVRKP